jgi:hypothetical protein
MTSRLVQLVRRPAAFDVPCSTLSSWNTMSDPIASPAVRAPDFPDTLDWLHTGGRRLTLGDFRGKLLLLDFWTYG